MLRGAVPDNIRVVLATAARVEIVFLSGEGRSPEGEGGAVGGTRQEAVRRGETWAESSSRNTPREEHPHRTQHFSTAHIHGGLLRVL